MLLHRNAAVFDVLDDLAALAATSAMQLERSTGSTPEEGYQAPVEATGERARELTHAINERLVHAFQPTVDAEDTHRLGKDLSEIVSAVEAVTRRLRLHQISPAAGKIAKEVEVLSQAARNIDRAIRLLRDKRHLRDMSPLIIEIHRLKEAGDEYRDTAIAALYDGSSDALSVLKETELHDLVSTVLDRCKDISNVLERVLVKVA